MPFQLCHFSVEREGAFVAPDHAILVYYEVQAVRSLLVGVGVARAGGALVEREVAAGALLQIVVARVNVAEVGRNGYLLAFLALRVGRITERRKECRPLRGRFSLPPLRAQTPPATPAFCRLRKFIIILL